MARLVDLSVVTYTGAMPIPGVSFTHIPFPKGRVERYYVSAWRARAALQATTPDIIHAHGDDFLLGASAPIIRTFYGSSLNEAWSSRGLRRYNHFMLGVLERWSARRATVRLAIAPETVDLFGCEDLFPPFFGSSTALNREPDVEPTIVFIGSFYGRKQGWLAQRAVHHLRTSGNRPKARLVVIGPPSDAPNWDSWVEHHSGLPDHDVSTILSRAWLLMSPSLYEGFGIPIVEALAQNVPVVAVCNPGSQYICDVGGRDVPIQLTTIDDFVPAVSIRISKGPMLDAIERKAAQSLISKLAYAGSPERLAKAYEGALQK